jgi:uncharacterized protein YjdB
VVASIDVSPAADTLDAFGLIAQYQARALQGDGSVITGTEFRWSSSNPSVASIDSLSGHATATANGSATIVATAGGASGAASLTIAQVATGLSLDPTVDTLTALFDTVRVTAVITDRMGNDMQALVSWNSSDQSVAEVNDLGVVTARGNGTVVVAGTVQGVADSAWITVAQSVQRLAVSPDSILLKSLTAQTQLGTQAVDRNDNLVVGVPVTWSGTNDIIAVDSSGVVTARTNGTAWAVATAEGHSDSALVSVQQQAVALDISVDSVQLSAIGEEWTLDVLISDSLGYPIVGLAAKWETLDSSTVTVDSAGRLIAISEGVTRVAAAVRQLGDTVDVLVEQQADPSTSSMTALRDTLPADGAAEVTITVQLSDANGNDLGRGGAAIALSATLGSVGTVTDHDDGSYSATLTAGTIVGMAIISGTVNGAALADSVFVELVAACRKESLTLDVPAVGELDTADCESPHRGGRFAELFTYAGGNSDVITVRLQSPDIDTYLFVLDPDSILLASNDDCTTFDGLQATNSCLINFTLPRAGAYTIEATSADSGAAGSYTVLVESTFCSLASPDDADGDRLPDCVETNTGVFNSQLDTGTDPNNGDTDTDGIADGDEVLGTPAGLDLPLMGVNPLRMDILIEYDWFDDARECSPHSHRPTAAAVTMVTTAFRNAPVVNPDGSTGVNLIHDYGQGGVFVDGNLIADSDGVLAGGVNGTEFQNHKSANFDSNRAGYFHYTILPHRYNTSSGSSGQAELPGDDMIVSLYCAGTDRNVGHTIMHELGHNLFIRHGGFESTNYKPNYNSVMNYKYQFQGVDNDCTPPGDGTLDYSTGVRPELDENNLDETQGVCGNPPGPGWDWNGDGDAIDVGIVVDINNGDDRFEILRDSDDWTLITLRVLSSSSGALVAQEIISCTNPAPAGQR